MTAQNDQPSRRHVLKSAAVGAVALAGAPNLLSAMQNAQKANVLGSGAHTYEVVADWGKLPDNVKFGNCHGVCETADGRIFIHNTSPSGDCVVEFDADGKFIRSWGKEFGGGSHGMQLRKEGGEEFLYFATTGNHRVIKTNLKGEHVLDFGYPKEAKNAKVSRVSVRGAVRWIQLLEALGALSQGSVKGSVFREWFLHGEKRVLYAA